MIKENLLIMYEQSFRDNWELPAFSDYGTDTLFRFCDMAEEIARLHLLFEYFQISRGDKIALVGKDCARWGIAYMSVITYGAVIVPILQDFHPNDIRHIINHSESSFLFVSDRIWDALDVDLPGEVKAVLSLSDFSCLNCTDRKKSVEMKQDMEKMFDERYSGGFSKEHIRYPEVPNDALIEINYTSGTTGFSKGVMLTANNLAGNVTYAQTLDLMFRGDNELCFLPMAHAYSCAFNLLVPMAVGAHVHILGKTPTPKILLQAFADVKPNLIITVPLILEKIYKKMILPQLSRRAMKLALSVPLLANRIYAQICKKLIDALGGRFCEVIVGGAAMNQEVTDFLCKIKFPVTIGYGMTECGPLISYSNHRVFEPTSCGHILKDIMDVRIDSPDPYSEVGEIQVRGENVMTGYYKNEEVTRNAFTEDGWLHTGDLGTIDEEKRIFIRGRSKTMILSSNGQNIYPEEVEAKLNNMPFVLESLVVECEGKIIALVCPDYEQADSMGISHEDLPLLMEHNCKEVNKQLAPYEHIARIELYPTEFEKTPKKSIKRYLYTRY
ncbi:MAG TPA: long-chain fatty acid--CoA ligase [Porphyromonadaceae bacterium]|nr:long-chain fatty acid--CoA ligase [Porphyromonadaceae bacterium]